MERKCWLFVLIISTLITGCGKIDDYLVEKMQEKSGITDENSYIQYQKYVEEGKIDSEGLYVDDITAEDDFSEFIHVTLAKNRKNLDVVYFSDKEHENPIDADEVYLLPGQSLYATVEISDDIYTSTYEFSDFRIFEWDEENRRKESTIVSDFATSGEVLSIPVGFEGKELSVEPIGLYQEREIHLSDYLVENEEKQELTGKWIVNEKEFTEEKATISPITSYIVSYEYDNDEYFFISSSPECFYNNIDDGVVVFKQKDACEITEDYSVELHRYIEVTLVSDKDRSVSINGGDNKEVKANNEIDIPRLKYGDYVTIETDKEWEDLQTNREIILTNSEKVGGKYIYKLVVPQKGAEFVFDPSEYQYEHGKIVFKCFGTIVNDVQYLSEKSRIYYEADSKSVEEGYWLPEGEHCIIVGDEDSTKAALKAIHFTQMVPVEVSLPQPESGGEIQYFVDGKNISENVLKSYSGTVITMEFDEWEGWKSNCTDGVEYFVKEDRRQVASPNGTTINKIFTEDDEHKPELTVVLEKSVGEDMRVDVTSAGVKTDEQANTYVGAWYRNDYKLIDGKKIGTDCPIELSMKNKAIQSGKAIRVVITKKEKDTKKKIEEKRYIVDLSKIQEPIYVYEPWILGKSKAWYESIDINISVVDINTFNNPKIGMNQSIIVRNATTNDVYRNGDLLEKNQDITFSIVPEPGYYISGKGTSAGQYVDKMKYSDFVKKIDDIIEKHPALKIYKVTLDASDAYANYTYKLDGEVVSGSLNVRDGQKLELKYEITNSGYRLESNGGILGIGASDKIVTKSIEINSSYDGKKITKEDFDIKTVKGE